MHEDVTDYFNVLLKFQCGFRKAIGAQSCRLYMIETIRKPSDNDLWQTYELSKAIGCISHELLIAKINVYGFGETSLKVIISYLKNHMQTKKVGWSFNELLNIIYGVPQ